MNRDDLLTRADLERLWGVGKCAAAARVRKYGRDVRKIKIGPCDAFAITLAEANRLEAECKARANEARRTNGRKRSAEFMAAHPEYIPARRAAKVKAEPKPRVIKPEVGKKKARKGGWKDGNTTLFLPKIPAPVEPALPPCEPTIRGLIQRYHVSEKTIRGWIIDNLLRFDSEGLVDEPSMARVARCYQPRRASRWMERTLAEYGEV
jgi:hypothetical protein